MPPVSDERLVTALRNAVKAGDMEAARELDNEIERRLQAATAADAAAPAADPAPRVNPATVDRSAALEAIASGRAEIDDFGSMFYSTGMHGRAPTIDVGAMRRQYRSQKLKQEDPGLAQVVEETGPFEALGIGYGEGTASWLRGVGAMEQASEDDRRAMQALRDQQPMAAVGKMAGQIAPFLVPGLGLARIPALAARIGWGSAFGAAEGAILAKGEGGDAEQVVQGAGLGLLFGAGAEVIGPVASRIGRGLITRSLGREAAAFDAAGNPTPELLDALRQSGATIDDLVRAASQDPETLARLNAAQAADAARAQAPPQGPPRPDGTPPGAGNFDQPPTNAQANPLLRAIAEGRVRPEDVRPDRETLDALDALGLSNAPPAVASQNPAFTGIYGAMSALPTRRELEELKLFLKEADHVTEQTLARLGADRNLDAVSSRFRDRLNALVDDASKHTRAAYARRDEIIRDRGGFGAAVDLEPLRRSLGDIANDYGGVDRLRRTDPALANLLDEADRGMTFAHVDGVLKQLNAAKARNAQGGFANLADYQRDRLINALEDVRGRHAASLGDDAAEAYKLANAANVKKQQLIKARQALIGKKLVGEIIPTISRALGAKRIGRGDIKAWRNFMDNTPDELKGEVVATAISANIIGEKGLRPTEFRQLWENLSRQPQLRDEVLKHLPERAAGDLRNLYLLTRGLSNINETKIRTGFLDAVLRDIDREAGWFAKLKGAGKPAAAAVGLDATLGSPAIATAMVLGRHLMQPKASASDMASDFLARPEFREAIVDFARRGRITPVQNRRVQRLKAYRDWLAAQPPAVQARVASVGLIPYLFDTEPDPETPPES